jgi:hypothetical protein
LQRPRISDTTDQVIALSTLVRHVSKAKRKELAEAVRKAANDLPKGEERNGVVARTAKWLPKGGTIG